MDRLPFKLSRGLWVAPVTVTALEPLPMVKVLLTVMVWEEEVPSV